jgi:ATP-dependent Clp protease ATP-binding subunit ClpA
VFERFTDRARRVVVLAQEEARRLNHNYIGTEHILLGLSSEGEGIAAKALESLGISLRAVRSQVEEIIGQGRAAPTGHIPFTPRAKKVLELSLREALNLGHNYIGTEHILLGVIREGEGVAAQVLVTLGADLNRTRAEVLGLLSGHTGGEVPAEERTPEDPGWTGYWPQRGPSAMALFNEAAVRAIHVAQELAAKRGRQMLSPEHLLMGLLGTNDQQVIFILRMLGASEERIREMISNLMTERGQSEKPPHSEEPGAPTP